MNDSCQMYVDQIKKAKETVEMLENQLHEIRLQIQKNNDANDYQMLRKLTLDMTITLNELEHSQFNLDQCKSKFSKV